MVGDLAAPSGMCMLPLRVEAAGLVTRLHGTGSDPPPSRHRQILLGQMQARDIEAPNTVLASPDTALVVVQAFLRPGIQKGDRFDVEVRVPPRD
jgi:flagellar basal body P-ring protein FlgI